MSLLRKYSRPIARIAPFLVIIISIKLLSVSGCREREITNPVDTRYNLDPPEILSALEISYFQFYLSWENNQDLYTEYIVYRRRGQEDFKQIVRVSSDANSFIDSTYSADSSYSYGLAGLADKNESIIQTPETINPSPEYGTINSEINFYEQVVLSWVITVENQKKIILEKFHQETNSFYMLAEFSPDINTYTDKDVQSGQAFTYRLSIMDQSHMTYYMNPLTVTIGIIFEQRFVSSGDEFGMGILRVSENDFILVGNVINPNSDIRLIKTNTSGEIFKTNTIGTPDIDYYSASCKTRDGHFTIAVLVLDPSQNPQSSNAMIVKIDPDGNEIWRKGYSGKQIRSIQQTSDGGYILGGNLGDHTAGWVMKTDESGNQDWEQTFELSQAVYSVMQLNGGEYIIVAEHLHQIAGQDSTFIARLNISGNTIQKKTTGGKIGKSILSKTNDIFSIADVDQNQMGYVIKFNSTGEEIWSTAMPIDKDRLTYPRDIIELNDGSVLISAFRDEPTLGETQYRILLANYSADGELIWHVTPEQVVFDMRTWNPNDNLSQIPDNKVWVLGTNGDTNNTLDKDFYIFRFGLNNTLSQ